MVFFLYASDTFVIKSKHFLLYFSSLCAGIITENYISAIHNIYRNLLSYIIKKYLKQYEHINLNVLGLLPHLYQANKTKIEVV